MSLMQRVERAQQLAAEKARAAEEAKAAAEMKAAAPTKAAPPTKAPIAVPIVPDIPEIPELAEIPESPDAPVKHSAATRSSTTREDLLREVRLRLQAEMVSAFDQLLDVPPEEVRLRIQGLVDGVLARHDFAVTRDERARLIEEMVHDVTGFGPLEPLLSDESITEVMVNGPTHIYIERRGKIERIDSVFLNDEHVLRVIDRIIAPLGRRIDESSPRVDARLPDGSRVNAIIEPLSLVGPVITVRKFSTRPFTVDDLIRFGTATAEMFDFLKVCIEARLNLFVSGGTGSGKTTTLNVLSSFIPNDERIVTIEDAAELQLRQEHVITLEARPPNLEGTGEITIRNLLRNAMHMRPDRIIVGECRAGEALDMLQAMNSGQDGSLSTGHANSPKDMLRRLETMILMTGYDLPMRAIREQMASAIDLIVHTARLKDGTRKIVNITEVYGIDDDEILTQDIFVFEQTDFVDGKLVGELKPTGIRPTFMAQFRKNGIPLPPGEFGIPPEDPDKPDRSLKARLNTGDANAIESIAKVLGVGQGKTVKAGGMVYVSGIGPVNPETSALTSSAIKDQTRQCLANLKAQLEAAGTSLDKVVWANWALRDATEFDLFNEEWVRWFPGDSPLGQLTMLPPLQRRAGFRVSLGVIAEA